MNDEDGEGVIKYSGLLSDLLKRESSDRGFSCLIILNISERQVYLYKLWTVRRLLILNNGLVCSFA